MLNLGNNLAAIFAVPGLALAGLLLAAIPILIHILNRRRYKVHRWAAMDYLLEALRRNRRRLKFEHWLLMLLRCCAILLFGLALARPLGCSESAAGRLLGQTNRLDVIVIDNSASMAWQSNRAETRTNLDRAKKLAGELVGQMNAASNAVCVIPAAEGEVSAASRTPSYDLEAVLRTINQVPQKYTRGDLAAALQAAVQVAREQTSIPNRRLYLFTDSTKGAWQSPHLAEAMAKLGPELAGLFEIVHVDVGEKEQRNAAVDSVRVLGSVTMANLPMDLAAQAKAFGGSSTQSLLWTSGTRTLGTSANVRLDTESSEQTLPQISLGGEGPAAVTVKLDPPDRLPEDDELSLSLAVRRKLSVLVVEGERGTTSLGSPAAFVQMALSPGAENGEGAGTAAVTAIGDSELSGRALGQEDAVVFAAVSRPTPEIAAQLKSYVHNGGTLILFMGEGVSADAYNNALLPAGLMPGRMVSLVTLSEGQEPFRFDFRPEGNLHPLLRVFRGEERSGLGTARVWTYARIGLDEKVRAQRVLDLAGGDPGITLQQVGRGKVVCFTTSADMRWTTLPGKPAFVALLNEIVLGTVDPANGWMNLLAGQKLEVPRRVAQRQAPRLSDPAGHGMALEPADASRPQVAYMSETLEKPGLYRLQIDGRTYPISVRFPAEESDTTRVDAGAIRRALGNAQMQMQADELPRELAGAGSKNDFGWPLLLAALGVLGVESFLAMWFRR